MPLGPNVISCGIFVVNLLLLGELFCKQTDSIALSSEPVRLAFILNASDKELW